MMSYGYIQVFWWPPAILMVPIMEAIMKEGVRGREIGGTTGTSVSLYTCAIIETIFHVTCYTYPHLKDETSVCSYSTFSSLFSNSGGPHRRGMQGSFYHDDSLRVDRRYVSAQARKRHPFVSPLAVSTPLSQPEFDKKNEVCYFPWPRVSS